MENLISQILASQLNPIGFADWLTVFRPCVLWRELRLCLKFHDQGLTIIFAGNRRFLLERRRIEAGQFQVEIRVTATMRIGNGTFVSTSISIGKVLKILPIQNHAIKSARTVLRLN